MMSIFRSSLLLCISFTSTIVAAQKNSAGISNTSTLKLLSSYEIPYNVSFKSTTVGGLSGVDYDRKNGVYYFLSDDRSMINPSRFYKAKIKVENDLIDTVTFLEVHTLLREDGSAYAEMKKDPLHSADPEAIRYDRKNNRIVWTSEGDRIVREEGDVLIVNPSIMVSTPDGKFVSAYRLPSNLKMQKTDNGPRQNGTLEGITFDDDFKTLYVSMEEPLYEDGPRAEVTETESYVRIYKFTTSSQSNVAQYAYKLERVAYPTDTPEAFRVNGISEILYAGDDKLLVMERSFSSGRMACTIKIFLADLSKADDVTKVKSLKEHLPLNHPVGKKLLLNMDDLGIYTDNVEGITFGPDLSNGHKSLILISDNNFLEKEKMQVFLLEIIP